MACFAFANSDAKLIIRRAPGGFVLLLRGAPCFRLVNPQNMSTPGTDDWEIYHTQWEATTHFDQLRCRRRRRPRCPTWLLRHPLLVMLEGLGQGALCSQCFFFFGVICFPLPPTLHLIQPPSLVHSLLTILHFAEIAPSSPWTQCRARMKKFVLFIGGVPSKSEKPPPKGYNGINNPRGV